jgi:hypothetical protein
LHLVRWFDATLVVSSLLSAAALLLLLAREVILRLACVDP